MQGDQSLRACPAARTEACTQSVSISPYVSPSLPRCSLSRVISPPLCALPSHVGCAPRSPRMTMPLLRALASPCAQPHCVRGDFEIWVRNRRKSLGVHKIEDKKLLWYVSVSFDMNKNYKQYFRVRTRDFDSNQRTKNLSFQELANAFTSVFS